MTEDATFLQALWDGLDTVETQKKIVTWMEGRRSVYEENAQAYLEVLADYERDKIPLHRLQDPVEWAKQRVWRLKAYGAPQEWVKRAVDALLVLEESEALQTREEIKVSPWKNLLQGPDTIETQEKVVQWLKTFHESDYFQAKDHLLHLRTKRSWSMSQEEQLVQAIRRLKAYDAPKEWVSKAMDAFIKFKFH